MKTAKTSLRKRADKIKPFRCKNLIAVLENPKNINNIGTAIRNINALGVEKIYVVDERKLLPDDWQQMRERKSLSTPSVSAVKWSFVKRFDSTQNCLAYLHKKKFISVVTSPHIKGKKNTVLHEGNYTHPRLAVWFGNESKGISDEAIEASEACISIPMHGIIESLNLGTSTGIVLYEITKQRRKYKKKRHNNEQHKTI